jgi:hypothetical protein
MSFPRINLNGISLDDFPDYNTPPVRTRRDFKEPVKEEAPPINVPLSVDIAPPKRLRPIPPPNRSKIMVLIGVFGLAALITIISLLEEAPYPVPIPATPHLRKIIRMTCNSESGATYCSSNFIGLDYVLDLSKCQNVYETNGIPITELNIDKQHNYRVPASSDNTLVIKEQCDSIVATVDSDKLSNAEYASNLQKTGKIYKVVWVAENCYTDFTLKLNSIVVLDRTPASMIEHKTLRNKTIYTYNPELDTMDGSISISGSGCIHPIFIYSHRII